MRGVDDLDFFIGDEAIDKPSYSTKVNKKPEPVVALSDFRLRGEKLTSVFPLRLPVANPSRDSGGLGPDGEIYGADHLQVSAGRT